MKARLPCAMAVVSLAMAIATPAFAQSVLLRLNPDEGLVSKYRMSMEMDMDAPMMQSEGPFMISKIYTTQTVTSVRGDTIEYTLITDSADVQTPGMPMMQGQMPDLAGDTAVMRLDSRGRMLEIPTTGLSPEEAQMVSQAMRGIGMELPEQPVSPGDSWTADMDFGAPGGMGGQMSMNMSATYTLENVDGGLATISFDGPITMSGNQGGMGMEAAGTMAGTMVFDVERSRIVSMDTQVDMNMNASGMSMSMIQHITMELIEG